MPDNASTPVTPLGAHVSVAGGLPKAFERGDDLGCDSLQIFVKNASQWKGRALADDEVTAFRAAHQASPTGPLVAHASYLINLAATDPKILEKSLAALGDELDRCGRLGVDGLVLHPGAHLGAGEEEGLAKISASLDAVLGERPDCPTRVLLENTAGQGTVLGYRLEQLAAIRAGADAAGQIGYCLDTCHAFAAGYPVHERAGYEEWMEQVAEILGLERVGALHLNDSKQPFGSRKDRHENIGEGEIGAALFARLIHDERWAGTAAVLETPLGDDEQGHRRDLERLRSL